MSPSVCGCSTGRDNPFHLAPCLPTSGPQVLPVLPLHPRDIPAEGRVSRGDVGPGQGTREVQDTRTPSHPRQSWPCPLPQWQCHAGGDMAQAMPSTSPRQCPAPFSDEGQQRADADDLSTKQTNSAVVQELGFHLQLLPTAASTVGTEPSSWKTELSLGLEIKM